MSASCLGHFSSTDSACRSCLISVRCAESIGVVTPTVIDTYEVEITESVQETQQSEITPAVTSAAGDEVTESVMLPAVVIEALKRDDLSSTEKLMLTAVCIRSKAGKTRGTSTEIGAAVGISRRATATEALKKLQALGLIEVPSGSRYWRLR